MSNWYDSVRPKIEPINAKLTRCRIIPHQFDRQWRYSSRPFHVVSRRGDHIAAFPTIAAAEKAAKQYETLH